MDFIILAGMRPVPVFGGDEVAFARLYPTIAEEEAVILIPSFLADLVNISTGNSGLTQVDGVHPTAAGYKVAAETVYPYAVKTINQLS